MIRQGTGGSSRDVKLTIADVCDWCRRRDEYGIRRGTRMGRGWEKDGRRMSVEKSAQWRGWIKGYTACRKVMVLK